MNFDITVFLLLLFPLIMAITLHEAAHAWMAYRLGDDTAFMLGRVTLSPIKHIDPIGTIAVPILLWFLSNGSFTFGWAKPVPFNTRKLKNYRRDVSLIAFAGPASNILMGIFWGLIMILTIKLYPESLLSNNSDYSMIDGLRMMGLYGLMINILLAVLNLMPIPPLDGGRIAISLLPYKPSQFLSRLEPYGLFIIIALVSTQIINLGAITGAIIRFFFSLFGS